MILKNAKIGTRLILGFVAIASLTAGIISIISFSEFHKLQSPLTHNIPEGLKQIEKTSYLDSLAQQIQDLEQIMTDSVRNYIKTGDRKFKYRFNDVAPKLEQVIRQAIAKGDEYDKKIFSDLYKAKKLFGETENEAINATDNGNKEQALQLIEGTVYWQLKEEYKEKLKAYAERRGKKYGETLVVTSSKVDAVVKATYRIVQNAIQLLIMVSIFVVMLAILLGFIISRSISNPIKILQNGAGVIGKGNLDHRIQVKTGDEIGQLAVAFNEMAQKLQESYSGLEDKVREKTKDLAVALRDIEQEKVRYEALLEGIGDGMMATDKDGKIMMMNKPAEEMLGCEMKDVIGQMFDQVIYCEDEKGKEIPYLKRPVTLALASGSKISSSLYYRRKNGDKFPAATTVSPIVSGGKTIGSIEIFRDVTREKEIDQMKSEFISTVSHELRTPLTVIREGVSLVMDGVLGQITDDQRKFLTIALSDIDRLKRIIDNLLDVSKIEAGKVGLKRDVVDLIELARSVADIFDTRAKNKGLVMKTRLPSQDKLEMYVDRDRIIQVFTNLIGNAMKFTDKGHIEISIEDGEKMVHCAVSDTGRGISEEDLPKIFGKFVQVGRETGGGEKGTGLGLSIAKGIVNLHGGKIWVESQLNHGTQFKFTIPKVSAKELFETSVAQGLKQAVQRGAAFSILTIGMKDFKTVEGKLSREQIQFLMAQLAQNARKCLRQSTDIVSQESQCVLMAFFGINASEATRVGERIKKLYDDFMAAQVFPMKPEVIYGVACYPEDGDNGSDLIKKSESRLGA